MEDADLITLFDWDEQTFLQKTEGSPIRRTGYGGWLRNLAVALGNMQKSSEVVAALQRRKGYSDLVDEHIDWALKSP